MLRTTPRASPFTIQRAISKSRSDHGLRFRAKQKPPRGGRGGFSTSYLIRIAGALLRTLREEVRRASVGCTGVAGSAIGQRDVTVRHRDQDHLLPVRAEVSRLLGAQRDGARGRPIVAGRDGQLSGDLVRTGEFIRRIRAFLTTVQAAPGGGRGGGSGYRVRCSPTESRNPERHREAATVVHGGATAHEVRILGEHGDCHEAREGDHGTGKNT
jgi:hypothetical protein